MNYKIGNLVMVTRGIHQGLIGHVHNVQGDRIFIVRVQEDLNKGLLPAMGDWHEGDIMKLYTDEELVYSCSAKCPCGAGLAYIKDYEDPDSVFVGVLSGYWDCSGILTGRVIEKKLDIKHCDKMPFSFYSIRSEDSKNTTRPVKEKK